MSDGRTVELIYFEGCPNAAEARDNLTRALKEAGVEEGWTEWDLENPETPGEKQALGSPTVLVDGEDVTGKGGDAEGRSCRADGAPSVEAIRRRLETA